MTNNIAPLILVVDDDPGFLEVMQAKLESQGYRSIAATDGNEAITKARQVNPSAILMDIEMPNKDGITAAAELMADPATKDIPTVFVTNLTQETASALAQRLSLHIDSGNYFRKDGDYGFLLRQLKASTSA